jgi:hypothetical protein
MVLIDPKGSKNYRGAVAAEVPRGSGGWGAAYLSHDNRADQNAVKSCVLSSNFLLCVICVLRVESTLRALE